MKIQISVPSGRDWKPNFCLSLFNLMNEPIAPHLGLTEEPVLYVYNVRSSNLCQNRHDLVRHAQREGASHMLWVDDDMTFPADTLIRLLKHNKPIMAANCTTRCIPAAPTAVKDGKRYLSKGRAGLDEVDQVGLAVVLCRMAIFSRVAVPWFLMPMDEEYPDKYMSEDMYFCRKAKAAGLKIWIDHDLSHEVEHIGDFSFSHDYTEASAECR